MGGSKARFDSSAMMADLRQRLTFNSHAPFVAVHGEKLMIDNFAGGGGASTGFAQAIGRSPDIAINHDWEALYMHMQNHPTTRHYCEDVFAVDPREATEGREVGIGWFSPDCTDHSKAKGGVPKSRRVRGLAWVILKWGIMAPPSVIWMENVEEWRQWGPLLRDGTPDKRHRGRTFQAFIDALTTGARADHPDIPEMRETIGHHVPVSWLVRGLGYKVEWRELRMCDYGAPTSRKRLFLTARCDGGDIVWAEPTHGHPDSIEVLEGRRLPWLTAADCVDWSLPIRSIWAPGRDLAENTLRRVAKGTKRLIIDAAKPFIINVAHSSESPSGVKRWGDGIHSMDKPIGTISGSNDMALVAPVMTLLNHAGGECRSTPCDMPVSAITGKHGHGLVTASIMKFQSDSGGSPATIAPLIVDTVNHGQRNGIGCASAGERTQCAQVKGEHFAMSVATLEPLDEDGMCKRAAWIVKHFGDNGQRPGSGMAEPMPAITGVDHNGLAAATLTGENKTGLAAAFISKMHGNNIGHPMTDPLQTLAAGGMHFAKVYALMTKFYGEGGQDQPLTDPMHTLTTKDRMALVTVWVAGEPYVIVDIGLRMLEPKELYRAMGFPVEYQFEFEMPRIVRGKIEVSKIPKHAQVRMCGNSVCPPGARAMIAANMPIPHQPRPRWRGGLLFDENGGAITA